MPNYFLPNRPEDLEAMSLPGADNLGTSDDAEIVKRRIMGGPDTEKPEYQFPEVLDGPDVPGPLLTSDTVGRAIGKYVLVVLILFAIGVLVYALPALLL